MMPTKDRSTAESNSVEPKEADRLEPYRRIVCCQGAAQLASAVAAMWHIGGRLANRTPQGQPIENHLIVHDLYSPDSNQTREFYDSIRHLAAQVEQWCSSVYLGPDEIATLKAIDQQQSLLQALTKLLGFTECSELYLSQNSVVLYDRLRQAYPEAEHICFGDGVGLNFSTSYHCFRSAETPLPEKSPEHPAVDSSVSVLQRWADSIEPPPLNNLPVHNHHFDQFCLLLPNLFDQHIDGYHQLASDSFIYLFARFAESFERRAPETHAALTKLNSRSGTSVILLSSYFSESGMMPREVEIEGYVEMLSRLPQGPQVDLIIKPHPRDSYEKLARLRELTAANYRHTLALTDPWTFYLPIESLVAKYFRGGRWSKPHRSTYIAAVGTSCVTLEFLYGQRCELGFKSEPILEQCSPEWRKLRSIHEYDLSRILPYVRKLRKCQHWRRVPKSVRRLIQRWGTAGITEHPSSRKSDA